MTSADRLRAARASAARFAFPAMLTGSIALAFGPWLVRSADVPPAASALWRMALAVLPLALLAVAVGGRTENRSAWGGLRPLPPGPTLAAIAAAGVLFALDLVLWHLGIGKTTLANATLVGNCASFVLPAYGFVVARMWPGPVQGVALALAAAGIGLLIGRSADVSASHLTGDLLCIGAGLAYAAYFIAVDRVRASVAPLTLLALATTFGALTLLPVAALTGPIWPHDWTPLILLALGSQVIGQGVDRLRRRLSAADRRRADAAGPAGDRGDDRRLSVRRDPRPGGIRRHGAGRAGAGAGAAAGATGGGLIAAIGAVLQRRAGTMLQPTRRSARRHRSFSSRSPRTAHRARRSGERKVKLPSRA